MEWNKSQTAQQTSEVGGLPLHPLPRFSPPLPLLLSLPPPAPIDATFPRQAACLPATPGLGLSTPSPSRLVRFPSIFARLSRLGGWRERRRESSSCTRGVVVDLEPSRYNRRWKQDTVASVFYGSETSDNDRSICSSVITWPYWFIDRN